MKCQNCGEHEANFKYTEIVNGVKKQLNLCQECARELGLDDFNIPIDFSSFFGDFLNEYNDSSFIPMLTKQNELTCNSCGMTYDEFMSSGKFGCSHCYEVFSDRIEPVLKRLHGGTKYLGRKSSASASGTQPKAKKAETKKTENTELADLKEQLKQAIKVENYEEAAVLRDKIKKIEGGK